MAFREANYEVVESTDERIVLRDIGPWDRYMTITNAAESVVAGLGDIGSRRVFYYDSDSELTELLVRSGSFAGFAPVDQGAAVAISGQR